MRDADKAGLRHQLRAIRSGRADPGERPLLAARLTEAITELLPSAQHRPGTLAGYLAARGEPDIGDFLAEAVSRGWRVVLPRTLPECALEWVAWEPDGELAADRHGLRAPVGDPVPHALQGPQDVVLVPALAVDRAGNRLGQGAGYYDRALARLPRWPQGPLRIAVVHPDEVWISPLPTQDHDAPVDAIATRDGWFRAGPGGREGLPA